MKKSQAVEEEMEDTELFKKALTGVKPIDNGNIAQIKPKRVKKLTRKPLQNVQQLKVAPNRNSLRFQILKRF
jgi:DNA-nicking Smr family endonuclease